jgi:hypothetical protein
MISRGANLATKLPEAVNALGFTARAFLAEPRAPEL